MPSGSRLSDEAVSAFREGFGGEVVLPAEAGYDGARAVWNGAIDRRPAIVARCSGAADVLRSVRFAREQDLVVAVRPGGHSVGGFSTCDDGIVIDLSPMQGVRVDPDRRVARMPEDAMAFTGREAAFWVGVETLWEVPNEDDAHVAWGRRTMEAITPFTVAGHYVNDVVESGTDVVRGIYGDAKYERLIALKRAWDPENVFHLNQNVRP